MKKLVFMILLALLSAALFAGGISIASNTYYTIPVAGWNLDSGGDSSSQLFNVGFLEEVEAGYAFDNGIILSLAGGFGFNPLKLTEAGGFNLYDVPLTINAAFPFYKVEAVAIYAKVGAGADFRLNFDDKYIYIGPMASVALELEFNVFRALYIGFVSKLNLTTVLTGSRELDLYFMPLALNVRYQF